MTVELKLTPGHAAKIGGLVTFTDPDSIRCALADVEGYVSGGLLCLQATDGRRAILLTMTGVKAPDGQFRIPQVILRKLDNLPATASNIELKADMQRAGLRYDQKGKVKHKNFWSDANQGRFPDISGACPDRDHYRSNGCTIVRGNAGAWNAAIPEPSPIVDCLLGDQLTFLQPSKPCQLEVLAEARTSTTIALDVDYLRDFTLYADTDVTAYFPDRGPIYAETERGLPIELSYWLMPCDRSRS